MLLTKPSSQKGGYPVNKSTKECIITGQLYDFPQI